MIDRSTEHYGLGQSGYTAGRIAGDRSLELQLQTRNVSYPAGENHEGADLGDDDRFTGRGARQWVPPPKPGT